MSLRHITIRALSCDYARQLVIDGAGAIRGVDPSDPRLEFFEEAYKQAVAVNYRIDRNTWVERNDRDGWLSRPSDPSDWPPCSLEDARFTLARGVWCDAVRLHYLERVA